MECWEGASGFERKAFLLVRELFAGRPELLRFIFDPKLPKLRGPVEGLMAEAKGLSSGEQTLIRLGVDLWCEGGGVSVNELFNLDPANLEKALLAIAKRAS